jgi:hypothetical protein
MTPETVVAAYERGTVAKVSAVSWLCDFATQYDPVSFAEQVPDDLLAELREQTLKFSKSSEIIILQSVCEAKPFDLEEWVARQRVAKERSFKGLNAWKIYFDSVA